MTRITSTGQPGGTTHLYNLILLEGLHVCSGTNAASGATTHSIVLAMAKNPIVLHYDLSSVRMVMLGAAPLGKDLEDELQDLQLPDPVIGQGYGMIEAGPVLAKSLALQRHHSQLNQARVGQWCAILRYHQQNLKHFLYHMMESLMQQWSCCVLQRLHAVYFMDKIPVIPSGKIL
ncbi:unnamed protein product [Sphagnum compactum]